MESYQKSATEWLQVSCWDFVKPRWNSFVTIFFLACCSARIFFLYHLCCMQFFSSSKRLQEIFFQNHPPPPSRVKWSAPKVWINCRSKLLMKEIKHNYRRKGNTRSFFVSSFAMQFIIYNMYNRFTACWLSDRWSSRLTANNAPSPSLFLFT